MMRPFEPAAMAAGMRRESKSWYEMRTSTFGSEVIDEMLKVFLNVGWAGVW